VSPSKQSRPPMDRGKMMFMIVAGVAVAIIAVFVIVTVVHHSSDNNSSSGPTEPFDAELAFAVRCAGCHGARGVGGQGPKLAGGAVVRDFPNIEDQIKFVTEGRPAQGMPAFGKNHNLTADQIRAIVEYTRTL
jgi:cytochrome c5